jgi:hypothetical protein
VDVGIASEVPDEAWTFKSPVVPELISTGVFIGEECKMEFIESALRFEASKSFLSIEIAEGFNEFRENPLKFLALVFGKFAYGDPRERARGTESNGVFTGRLSNFGHFSLFAIEHFVNAIGSDGLFPKYIAWVIGTFVIGTCGMSIEDRASKSDMLLGVPIAPKR